MIRPLRSRHRKLIVVLAVLVGPLFVAGLAVRRTDPAPGSTRIVRDPALTSRADGSLAAALIDGTTLRLRRLPATQGSPAEIVFEDGDLSALPELLVYWVPPDTSAASLDDGFLLGRLEASATGPWILPPSATPHGDAAGRIVFYSPAHREMWGDLPLAASGGSEESIE